jgi:hypothetical protein
MLELFMVLTLKVLINIHYEYSLFFFQIYDIEVLTKIHWTCIIFIGGH